MILIGWMNQNKAVCDACHCEILTMYKEFLNKWMCVLMVCCEGRKRIYLSLSEELIISNLKMNLLKEIRKSLKFDVRKIRMSIILMFENRNFRLYAPKKGRIQKIFNNGNSTHWDLSKDTSMTLIWCFLNPHRLTQPASHSTYTIKYIFKNKNALKNKFCVLWVSNQKKEEKKKFA